MTDLETALVRWREYAHDLTNSCRAPEMKPDRPLLESDLFTGWAHRELERRGHVVYTYERPEADFNLAEKTYVALCEDRRLGDDNRDPIFWGPNLLSCYLGAIEATEPAKS